MSKASLPRQTQLPKHTDNDNQRAFSTLSLIARLLTHAYI